ncbi:MAG: Rpp14/Pop5 family protein [Candidatus Caldarchaeum sp.]
MSGRLVRLKRRYVAVKPSSNASPENVSDAVRQCFFELYGKTGFSQSGLRKGTAGSTVFFSCYSEWVPKLVLAISLVRGVGGVRTVLKTVGVSGTVSGLKKHL